MQEQSKSHPPAAPHERATEAASASSSRALPRWLTPRLTVALAALMLGIGAALGAAIGPAPSASFAGDALVPSLLRSLLARSEPSAGAQAPATTQPAATGHRRRHRRRQGALAAQPASSAAEAAAPPSLASAPTPPRPVPSRPTAHRPITSPVSRVWLVELSGEGFASMLAAPASAPYTATQAIPAGTLLASWSALSGSAFAAEAALLGSVAPQVLDTIVQPSCPEGAACAAGTPGGLSAADAFLAQTVPAITASPSYREGGLIVVTFGSVPLASSAGLPPGAASAALSSRAPGGVLLISPFAAAGTRPASAFNPASPARSVHALLRR